MNENFLGVAAGIVAVGVAVMMGMFIVIGPELVMLRENWELARILVPSITSVVGWLVTIWWAIRQVNISAKKNRSLQRELLRSNEKLKIMDGVVERHASLEVSITELKHQAGLLKINIEYAINGSHKPDLKTIFANSGKTFEGVVKQLQALQFQTMRLNAFAIRTDDYDDFFVELQKVVTGEDCPWGKFQLAGAEYLRLDAHDERVATKVCDSVSELLKSLTTVKEKGMLALAAISVTAQAHSEE